MRSILTISLGAIVFTGMGTPPASALDQEQETAAVQLLAALARGENIEAAQQLGALLEDPAHPIDDWRRLFESAYDPASFTPALARFWSFALDNAMAPARIALISGHCANVTVGMGLSGRLGEGALAPQGPVDIAMGWLHRLAQSADPATRERILSHLGEALSRGGAPQIPVAEPTPNLSRALLQVQLIAAMLAPENERRGVVSRALNLQGGARATWDRFGILLFDNAGLAEAQVAALHSVLEAIPADLHRISAFVVPETTGLEPASTQLTAQGQVVFLPAVAMGLTTEAAEFTRDDGQPVAPAFTVTAAQQVIRAVQEVQFERRPELRTRRDMIIANAGDEPGLYLRRTVAPEVYLENPDELLPSVAFPYAIDAWRTFRMAMELFAHRRRHGLDSYLLLADMLSGGSENTLLLHTDADGRLHATPAPIGRGIVQRVRLPHDRSQRVDMEFLNRLVISEREWLFRFSDLGGVTHWSRVR